MHTPVKKCHILILEDDEDLRRSIALALKMHQFEVHQANHGRQGLETLSEITPDLILSDINMPVMNGLNFLRAVRQNPCWTQIPFVFLTGNDSSGDVQAGREMGVEDYITKPIRIDNLLRIIHARLHRAAEIKASFFNQAFVETVLVLANTIESRDAYTHDHVDRVARYALWFCRVLDWPEAKMAAVEYGASLHDIGKIMVPDHILNKPGGLTAEEWELMKKHPQEGVRIIREIDLLREAIPYVLCHHEMWDGSGYPRGLSGRDIPGEGRMLAIVDVFDAMTTTRPYRQAYPLKTTLSYLTKQSGIKFDPDLVTVFIKLIEEKFPNGLIE